MPGGGPQQGPELAQDVGTDGVALVGEQVGERHLVARRHVEVVEPEVGEHLGTDDYRTPIVDEAIPHGNSPEDLEQQSRAPFLKGGYVWAL